MTIDEPKITTITSICVILLREVRAERGIHQAQVADWIGKTPSAWTKVEAGKSPLQFETFIRVCNSMQVAPSAVMAAAERYAALLSQSGWAVLASELAFEEDGLLGQAQKYWASPGCRNQPTNRWGFTSVLNGPIYNMDRSISLAAVFQFALDPVFQELQLNPPPTIPSHPPSPGPYAI
ncbi:HTH cro/C1-type domain-containing protein [Bordetella sputigena]|uniref:helix-turn-helix domain-containing protein n=1 Tax=Bordetella sputigena TaxID=1416810 RepID=UPI0039F0CB38